MKSIFRRHSLITSAISKEIICLSVLFKKTEREMLLQGLNLYPKLEE